MRRTGLLLAAVAAALGAGTVSASSVLGLTLEDQTRLSRYVVVGIVTGQQGIDHPENGLETEVTLRVTTALKGAVRPGANLVFHTRSGELNGESSIAVGETVLKTGQRILVFIEDIDGRLYNLGLSYGVFNALQDSRGRQSFLRAVQDDLHIVDDAGVGLGPFTFEDIRTRVSWAERHPRFDNPTVEAVFGEGRQR
ncbi:MAG TPA: hypothetical protein VJ826_16265 [Candidatus Polarisedimenticolaceae bacterium]|nr:hypothetical protein [Candidatus Polarisedimenticolaceae bacterium]